MSIASVSDANYTTVVEYCRGHLANGTSLSAEETRLTLAVLKNAVGRINACVTAITPLDAAGCAAASGATAAAVIAAQVTALGAPTYTTNTVMDG